LAQLTFFIGAYELTSRIDIRTISPNLIITSSYRNSDGWKNRANPAFDQIWKNLFILKLVCITTPRIAISIAIKVQADLNPQAINGMYFLVSLLSQCSKTGRE
jgi:hypothetical protein